MLLPLRKFLRFITIYYLRIQILIVFFISNIYLSGCRVFTPHYGHPQYGIDLPYLIKPLSGDSLNSASYISGNFYKGCEYEEGDKNFSGQINLHKSLSSKYYNFSYGSSCYYGQYNPLSMKSNNGVKKYGGLNIIGSSNFNIPFKIMDWRIIGVQSTLNYEAGSFYKFREAGRTAEVLSNLSSKRISMTADLNSEFYFNTKDNTSLGILFGLGSYFSVVDRPPLEKTLSNGISGFPVARMCLNYKVYDLGIYFQYNITLYGTAYGIAVIYKISK